MDLLHSRLVDALIPNAGLFGIIFAYLCRKRLATSRGATLWLVLILGITVLAIWVTVGAWNDFYSMLSLLIACAFAFFYPPCAFYWMRFGAMSVGRTNPARILVLALLAVLGVLWVGRIMLAVNQAVGLSTWN